MVLKILLALSILIWRKIRVLKIKYQIFDFSKWFMKKPSLILKDWKRNSLQQTANPTKNNVGKKFPIRKNYSEFEIIDDSMRCVPLGTISPSQQLTRGMQKSGKKGGKSNANPFHNQTLMHSKWFCEYVWPWVNPIQIIIWTLNND